MHFYDSNLTPTYCVLGYSNSKMHAKLLKKKNFQWWLAKKPAHCIYLDYCDKSWNQNLNFFPNCFKWSIYYFTTGFSNVSSKFELMTKFSTIFL